MLELLAAYSIKDIIIFIVLLSLAVKGVWTSSEWAYEKGMKFFEKQTRAEKRNADIESRFNEQSERISQIEDSLNAYSEILNNLNDKIDLLIKSDKDDIKSFIVEKHHYFCYRVGWIDDFSLDSIERRFEHYQAEKGNSYVENLMKELRNLPKTDKK